MTTFAALIDNTDGSALDLGMGYVLRVLGWSHLHANVRLPTEWDNGDGTHTIAGEDYTWHDGLLAEPGLEVKTAQANPKAGIAVSGAQTFRALMAGDETPDQTTDPWLAQFAISLSREGLSRAILQLSLTVSSTSATVDSTAEWSAPGELHANLECIGFSGKAATSFTGLARGLYGSPVSAHRADIADGRAQGGGPWLTSELLAWEGRLVELYAVPGTLDAAGGFHPLGDDLEAEENAMVFAGLVVNFDPGRDLLTANLDSADLTQLLARDVGIELPQARAGVFSGGKHNTGTWWPIDETNWWVTITWWRDDSAALQGVIPTYNELRLIRDDGAGGTEDVPEGLYHRTILQQYLATTIASSSGISPTNRSATVNIHPLGATLAVAMKVSATMIAGSAWELELNVVTGSKPNNLWKLLGFEEDITIAGDNGTLSYQGFYDFQASRPLPLFYLPPARYGVTRIYYSPQASGGLVFVPSPGWVDDTGAAIKGFAKVGKSEIVRFDGIGLDNGALYLSVVERECLGSVADEEVYIESNNDLDEVDSIDVIQGVVLSNTSVARTLLYFILGGSGVSGFNHATYDKGWRGSGIYVPAQYVNVDSFERYHRDRVPSRDHFAAFKPTKLRDMFAGEFVVEQALCAAQNLGDGNGYRLALLDMDHPTLDADDGQVLDDDTIDASSIQIDASHKKLINVITWKGAYDHATGKYRKGGTSTQQTSVATFGPKAPLTVAIQSIASPEAFERRMAQFAARIFSAFAWPYLIITLEVVGQIIQWTWQLCSIVRLSAHGIPALERVGRGVEELRCLLLHKSDRIMMDPDDSSGSVVLRPANGRFARWAPAARSASKTLDIAWTFAAHTYSDADDGFVDVECFGAGWGVKCWTPGERETAQTAVISTINPATGAVVFDGAGITLAHPIIMTVVAHNHADSHADARTRLYMTDGDHTLTLPDATTVAHMEYL